PVTGTDTVSTHNVFYNPTVDNSDPYNPIFTSTEFYNGGFIMFNNLDFTTAYNKTTDDFNLISYYVNNPAGNGTVQLDMYNFTDWKNLSYPIVYLYDITSGTSTRLTDGAQPVIPDGFNGFVIVNVGNDIAEWMSGERSKLFTSGQLSFYYTKQKAPITFSIGSITLWSGDLNNVLLALQKSMEPEPLDLEVYELLDTENYQAGDNTDGITQNIGLANVVDGKTLNGITVNSDIAENANVYIDCKTPAEAGMDISNINGFSYYFKNVSGREVSVAFEYANGDTYGRLTGGLIYTVPVNYESAKIAQIAENTDGAVKIPAGFEGYIVYDSSYATDKSLLNADTTFGTSIRLRFASELKAGDAFYYGDVCAFIGKDTDYITSVKSDAVYQYPLVTGVASGMDNAAVDNSNPYNPIFTGVPTNNFVVFQNKNIITDYNRSVDDINVVSFYVKNQGGKGDLTLRLGCSETGYYTPYQYFYLYDLSTGEIIFRTEGAQLSVPAGFEGYVIFSVSSDLVSWYDEVRVGLFTSGRLALYHEQAASMEMSFGSVTVWSGKYDNIIKALRADQNIFSVETKNNDEYEFSIEYTENLNTAFDGSVVNVYNWGSDAAEIELKYDFSATSFASHINEVNYPANAEALTLYFKNEEGKTLRVSGVKADGNAVNFTYKLFDTAKQTMTAASVLGTDVIVPDGFEGYIVMYPESVGGTAWKDYFATNDISVVKVALDITDEYLGAEADCYVGKLSIVKSVNDFIKANLAVTLEGDANRDGKVDLLDLIRLKKNSAGNEGAVVYVPNVSYGGNNDVTSASTVANLRKQLLGAEHDNAFVSDEVLAALVS
ncbi:MAG: hypothetical protein ACI4F7_12680, partial [Acutalibacteraceae bacterium]